MSNRPPVFVLALTVADFLLWHWSLNGNHDVLALISGLTLPPLVVACVCLLALNVARVLAASATRRNEQRARASADAQALAEEAAETAAGRRRAAAESARKLAA